MLETIKDEEEFSELEQNQEFRSYSLLKRVNFPTVPI